MNPHRKTQTPRPALRRHRALRPRVGLALPLTLLAISGCIGDQDEGDHDDAALVAITVPDRAGAPPRAADLEIDPESEGEFVLALTGTHANAPVLSELAVELETVDGQGFSPAALASVVARSRALTVDLARATPAQLDAWRPVFAAAHAAHVPIIFDRAHDAGAMTRALGFGIEADTVVAESLAPTPGYRLRAYGIGSEPLNDAVEAIDADINADAEREERHPLADASLPLASVAPPEQVVGRILDALDKVAAAPLAPQSATKYPPGSYAEYIVQAGVFWSPKGDQVATMDIDFSVELFAAADNQGGATQKYMIVKSIGSGVNPGELYFDTDWDVGYFQERLDLRIRPLHHAINAHAHAPNNQSVSSSYTPSTGTKFDVNLSLPPTVGLALGQGNVSPVTLESFSVTDTSSQRSSEWVFEMTAMPTAGPYKKWQDLVYKYGVHILPTLARETLTPKVEAVYSAQSDFTGVVRTRLDYTQTLRNTYLENPGFPGTEQTKVRSQEVAATVAVDFGVVNTPLEGTVRFDEDWSGSPVPNRWHPVDETTSDTVEWTVTPYNEVKQTGNGWGWNYGDGPDGSPRGTYLIADTTYFDRGEISTTVWPADDDTWGIMYSIQDSQNFYRAEINKEKNYARILKIVNGKTTKLADVDPPAPNFALSQWHDLKVKREGQVHRLYLDGAQVATAYDNGPPFGTGKIGLYAWGMSKIYFGPVHARRVAEPDRNLAYGRTVTCSDGQNGSRIVDGGTDESVWGTAVYIMPSPQPNCFIDLGATRKVNDITAWGAYGGSYQVEVLDASYNVAASRSKDATYVLESNFNMNGVEGRFIRLRMDASTLLLLSELEVFGPAD